MAASSESERFWSDGACVVRGVVPPSVVAGIADAIDSLRSDELADLGALAGSAGPTFAAGIDHWRRHDAFARLATTGVLPTVVAEILGTDRLWLYEDSVLVKHAGSTVETRWHTDDGYFHVEGRQLATLWVPVDPAPLTAGALSFVRGSHLADDRYRPTLFVTDDPLPDTEGSLPPVVDFDDPSVIGFDLDPGDLTIHHSRTLHAARGNSSATVRRALSIRYCGEDAVVRVKPGAPPKTGVDTVLDGLPLAAAAATAGLPEATLTRPA